MEGFQPHNVNGQTSLQPQKLNINHLKLPSATSNNLLNVPPTAANITNLTCAFLLLACTFSCCAHLRLGFLFIPSRQLSKPCCPWTFEVSGALEIPDQECLLLFLRPGLTASGLGCLESSTALCSMGSRTLGLLNRLLRESNTKVHSTYMVALINLVTTSGSANEFGLKQRWSFLLKPF